MSGLSPELALQDLTPIAHYLPQDVPKDLSGSVEEIVSSWLINPSDPDTNWDPHHVVGRLLSQLSLDARARFDDLSGGKNLKHFKGTPERYHSYLSVKLEITRKRSL